AEASSTRPHTGTAQATLPTVARIAASPAGSSARRAASAVVTTRPSTADLPTPGDPVTTSPPPAAPPRGRSGQATTVSSAVMAAGQRTNTKRGEAMTSPILVTGGSGTLGRLVTARLRDAGHHVRVLSRRSHESSDGTLITGS